MDENLGTIYAEEENVSERSVWESAKPEVEALFVVSNISCVHAYCFANSVKAIHNWIDRNVPTDKNIYSITAALNVT